MTLFQNKYRIESTRLKGWDYTSDGYYFVTLCIKNRDHTLGQIENGKMILNKYGIIVEQCWFDLPNHYTNIRLDAFVVMPDHVHAIVIIDNNGGMVENDGVVLNVDMGLKPVSTFNTTTDLTIKKRHGLFEFIRALKTFSARRINELRQSQGISVWQSRFHDRIIRNPIEYYHIKHYINKNPQRWKNDSILNNSKK